VDGSRLQQLHGCLYCLAASELNFAVCVSALELARALGAGMPLSRCDVEHRPRECGLTSRYLDHKSYPALRQTSWLSSNDLNRHSSNFRNGSFAFPASPKDFGRPLRTQRSLWATLGHRSTVVLRASRLLFLPFDVSSPENRT
jgi:hypothetical protein